MQVCQLQNSPPDSNNITVGSKINNHCSVFTCHFRTEVINIYLLDRSTVNSATVTSHDSVLSPKCGD